MMEDDRGLHVKSLRRRNCSFFFFLFKSCGLALILLQLFVPYVDATKRCSTSQFWVVHIDGTTSCEDCGSCPPGQGLSHECGKQILSTAMVKCEPCQAGISFSNKYDTSSCTPCGALCSEDQVVLQNCTTTMNVKCKKQCYSKDRYYDDHGRCLPCSKCCGDNKDVVENECKQKLGAASNMICSFFSSANRCDTTTTAASSAQETTTVINTSRTPVLFTLTRPRDATRTPSASTQQSTITQGAHQSLHLSKRKQELDNSANVAVIVPVAIIGLLLIVAGGATYFLYSRGRCSYLRHQRDPEMAIQYPPKGSQTCVVMRGEDVACQKLKNIDKVKLHGGITSAESSEPLLSKESAIPRFSCQEIENTEKGKKLSKSDKQKLDAARTESCEPLLEKDSTKDSKNLACTCQMDTKKESKPLRSLLNKDAALQRLCEMLDTPVPGCSNYIAVAQHYGFDHYQIASVLTNNPSPASSTRTRALIEFLAATYPDLTVVQFATVVKKKTKRDDVPKWLTAYDSTEDNTV